MGIERLYDLAVGLERSYKKLKRFEKAEAKAATWKRNTTQAGPVCHLTSWSSGRFRAARFSAAHQRVRRLEKKREKRFEHHC